MRPLLRVLSAFGLVLLSGFELAALAAPPTPVTCTVQGGEKRGRYFLEADLDCTGTGAALQLGQGGRLELRGHTLTGMIIWVGSGVRITGPGTIAGSPGDGIRHSAGLLTVRDATITGSARYGVVSLAGKVKLDGAVVTDNGIDGVAAYRWVVARDSMVTGNARFGVSTRPDGTNVEGGAPCTETLKSTVKLVGTTVTGNGTDTDCGTTEACADLATCLRLPRLTASTCDTSYVLESGIPGSTLGVCSGD